MGYSPKHHVLQVGLRAKVTPRRSSAAGGSSPSKGLEGTPAWHTEGKGDLENDIVFAFVMQIELISPSAQQLGTAVQLPKGKTAGSHSTGTVHKALHPALCSCICEHNICLPYTSQAAQVFSTSWQSWKPLMTSEHHRWSCPA